MPVLTLIENNKQIKLTFDGTPILREMLEHAGYAVFSPCGGRGTCGKCKVKLHGNVSEPNTKEIAANSRLACQAVLLGDATVEICETAEDFSDIETGIDVKLQKKADWHYGAAVDIGTTTVALKLFDRCGECIGTATGINPQRAVASDVIARIDAAMHGKAELLKSQIDGCINGLLKEACDNAGITPESVERYVVTGNTAMMYLYTSLDPESISRYPFESKTLFGYRKDEKTYLPPCMNAFVGGDITCAVLASGMCECEETALLCDIGTNGEIALWKEGRLYVTSTAAGPAFEGAEISCGCGNVRGAVDRVTVENGTLSAHTVENAPATGICGSGLVDAVSAFLKLLYIDETGYAGRALVLSANGGRIELTQEDIRAVQLAKAAIKAGIETVLERSGTVDGDIKTLYLAGGFGNHLSLDSAAHIGLIPESLAEKAKPIGNAALSGACMMLFDDEIIKLAEAIAKNSTHIDLAGKADFYEKFIDAIDF